MRKQILYYALKYQGEYEAIKKAIERNETYFPCEYEGNYVTIVDPQYPSSLLMLEKPPFILFYEGTLAYLNQPLLCVIGSRKNTSMALTYIEELMQHLSSKWCILSGVARGVDGLAHQSALNHHFKTIGVIGSGIDVIYPQNHSYLYEQIKQKGCLITEYPFHTPPLAHHFPHRNRILAALCQKCVVIEAAKKSGTLITVNYAMELGKEVWVFPHRYEDEFAYGSNQLIQLGANLILDKEDLQLL